MARKADVQRTRESLARERLHLKDDRLALERRERDLGRERAEALVWLRLLCSRYGDDRWPDETPLAEVLETFLAEPLAATLDRVSRSVDELQHRLARAEGALAQARRPIAPAVPSSPPLRLRTDGAHSVETVTAALRGLAGYRAECGCGWASSTASSEAMAVAAGERHVERFAVDQQARGS